MLVVFLKMIFIIVDVFLVMMNEIRLKAKVAELMGDVNKSQEDV